MLYSSSLLLASVFLFSNAEIQQLVSGGREEIITNAPYMAQVVLQGKYFICGASIIHKRFILSAAHCFVDNLSQTFYIYVGSDKQMQGLPYKVEKIIIHPDYDNAAINNDVAVLKLKRPLRFNDKVKPIKLADRNMEFKSGDVMETMGFGATPNSDSSELLLRVQIPYVDTETCKHYFKNVDKLHISKTMLCAGKEGHDSCQGDSGGPLVYKDIQVGIVSFGYPDCGFSMPGVYSRVSALRDFISAAILYNS